MAAVRAQGSLDALALRVEVDQEEVAVVVECQARVAAGHTEPVTVADDVRLPRRPAVVGDGREEATPELDIRDDGDVVGVGRVGGDGRLRLVADPLADVDVRAGDRGHGRGRSGRPEERHEGRAHDRDGPPEWRAAHGFTSCRDEEGTPVRGGMMGSGTDADVSAVRAGTGARPALG